ncbi:HindIII family type II restriction endonuclease [Candidatus Berkelbacteria bacterium CG10_big_fil_rev_8_21_14_0_10_43_13]|uniref:HindIII family type II restriction endonuclease n=1 Tax=Candidatus Berkelbacteria bacterium CG10_big_fil_rev_8_21_14_0_10_43_13 TaxID=1974514 RepID=A0A2H0W653_9BACT|nr:MAG: HindIII family type II restriction endonuclease [Candidatus Berkelbacteria bacterium CG10_big_fil_rev_8_21_14_0_10_43_13]
MKRIEIINFISKISDEPLSFTEYSERIISIVEKFTKEEVMLHLLECGIIPESFSHDSTEEKIYSKYSDVLLARALSFMGLNAKVLKERADSADVEGETKNYTIVADAKLFRLSRTAKNQKDFKVEALDKWKKDKDFACLVSPLYQYPKNSSQIYRQATAKNVTLFSYIHLYCILSSPNCGNLDYKGLWLSGEKLKGEKDASLYWKAIDSSICKILSISNKELCRFKKVEQVALTRMAKEEIAYIENKISEISSLTKEKAIELLIKAEKLDNRLIQIRKISGLK